MKRPRWLWLVVVAIFAGAWIDGGGDLDWIFLWVGLAAGVVPLLGALVMAVVSERREGEQEAPTDR